MEKPRSASDDSRNWYAVFTTPQHEKSVLRHMNVMGVEAFLPTYEIARIWKNRQRVKVVLPLFPSYLFVRISHRDHVKVLQAPGVLQVVGNGREPLPLPDSEVDFLRCGLCEHRPQPYRELIVGQRVRIKSGAMRGIHGFLVRKNDSACFVLTIQLINRSVAVEVDAAILEPLAA